MKYISNVSLQEANKDRNSVAFQEWCHFLAMNDPKVSEVMDAAIHRKLLGDSCPSCNKPLE